MSIWSTLYTGSSGLKAFGSALGVVGDNIANVSTTGFKGSRAGFEDVLGGTASNGQRIGAGVRMSGPQTSFAQGSLQQTGRDMDLAIRGNGMFVMRGSYDGIDGQYYSRDGRFGFDEDGNIVNSQGLRLQGYAMDPETAEMSPAAGDLRLPAQLPPQMTTRATMTVQLDANAEVGDAFDPTNPTETSNFSTSMTVYDSNGAARRVDVYFRSNGQGSWEWHALADGSDLEAGVPGEATEIASGTLEFIDGRLNSDTTDFSSADFRNATAGQAIEFDFGESIADGGTGREGSTQFGADSDVTATDQNGYASATLADLTFSDNGTIQAQYSNGQTREAGRLALAEFQNVEGLRREGASLFAETNESGSALIGAAATGARGSVSGGSLEGSNVDLGSELVTLIAYQRAFQANARTVTTADEMLAETANLKR